METPYEKVYTVTEWYDGERQGIADFGGKPHAYQCVFDDNPHNWSPVYLLRPVDEETLQLALEDWHICLRWDEAFKAGKVDVTTHPALPEDRARHEHLEEVIAERLNIPPGMIYQAKAEFTRAKDRQDTLVRWTEARVAGPDAWLRMLDSAACTK